MRGTHLSWLAQSERGEPLRLVRMLRELDLPQTLPLPLVLFTVGLLAVIADAVLGWY